MWFLVFLKSGFLIVNEYQFFSQGHDTTAAGFLPFPHEPQRSECLLLFNMWQAACQ